MKTVRWAAYSCTHVPLIDAEWEEWLLAQLEEFNPQVVVHLGDLFEAAYASRWPHEYEWTMEDELAHADHHLKKVREASPEAEHVLLMGNHDANMLSLARIPKNIGAGILDWRRHLRAVTSGEWEVGARYVYDRTYGTYRVGQVTFHHGYSAGVSADEHQSITLGMPFGLTVAGHTHHPCGIRQAKKTGKIHLPYYWANPGCGRTLKPDYVTRSYTAGWGQGVVLGEAKLWRYQESLMPCAPEWAAETRIFKMGEGYPPDFTMEL